MTAFAQGRGYRLALEARPVRGTAGERFGRGTGSSMEFQEFRDYQAGDDLRHVDWRAYARTETLTTRLYREEIAATVELIVDGSVSMALTPLKAERANQVASFLAGAASGDCTLRAFLASDQLQPLDPLQLQGSAAWDCTGKQSLAELPLAGVLRAGTTRIVLSDFLFACDPRALVRRLQGRAQQLALIQLLDPQEIEPELHGAIRLEEVESARFRELPVDDSVVRRYRERLNRHNQELAAEARRAGALFLQLTAGDSLPTIVRERFMPAEVVSAR